MPSKLARDPLGALFTDQRPAGVADLAGAREIKTSLLSPNPYQPRTYLDPVKLQDLANSLRRRRRVLQPLLVRQTPGERGVYQIAAGERRWRAAQLAELDTVPCIVEDLDDDAMEEIALTENIQREDLTDTELAHAFKRLLERHPDLSMRALSERLGKNHSYVEDKIKIVTDPHIAAAVEAGAIGPTVATEIADLADEGVRADLLARAAAGERIRVRDVQARRRRSMAASAMADDAAPPAPLHAPAQGAETATEGRVAADGALSHDASVTPVQTVPLDAETTLRPTERPGYGVYQEEGWRADDNLPLTHADRERLDAEFADAVAATAPRATVSTAPTVRLRDLRIVQLREGRDDAPRQLDEAERAIVLRILRADLAWLEEIERQAHTNG